MSQWFLPTDSCQVQQDLNGLSEEFLKYRYELITASEQKFRDEIISKFPYFYDLTNKLHEMNFEYQTIEAEIIHICNHNNIVNYCLFPPKAIGLYTNWVNYIAFPTKDDLLKFTFSI